MRILLFGLNGQVGWELRASLAPLGDVLAVDRPEVDFTDLMGLRSFATEAKPDLIVNAAAYTRVDQAELEPEIAMRVNGEAPGVLAEVAKAGGIGLVHYSSDYVFDGAKGDPYTEEDEPNPINVYGHTKLAGDLAIQGSGCAYLILRASWVYGTRGSNFLQKILKLAKEQDEIRVVCDQVGSPTWCRFLAGATGQILSAWSMGGESSLYPQMVESGGLYHCSAEGGVSRSDFAQEIMNIGRAAQEIASASIRPVLSEDFPTRAIRPGYTVLDTTKLRENLEVLPPTWREQLEAALGKDLRGLPR